MSHLYAMNSALSQGNMANARVEQENRDITASNNAIANNIKAADSQTTEKTFFQGAKDTLFDAYAIDKVNSKAEAYLTSAQSARDTITDTVTEATKKAQTPSSTETVTDKTSTTDVEPSGGAEAIDETEGGGIAKKALTAAGLGEDAAKSMLKGVGLIGSAVTLGTNLDADFDGQFGKMNFDQKVANVGEIAGSVLDIVGTVFPPAEILAVVGSGITALSGAVGGVGDVEGEQSAGKSQDAQLAAQKQALQQVSTQAGKTPIVIS